MNKEYLVLTQRTEIKNVQCWIDVVKSTYRSAKYISGKNHARINSLVLKNRQIYDREKLLYAISIKECCFSIQI